MSKKQRKLSPEIPRVDSAMEVPNYVTPATDLEYRKIMDPVDPHSDDCAEDCRGGKN